MPVLGHAFVGIGTAVVTAPKRRSAGAALWTPALIVLAYLPDIVNHASLLLGGSNRRLITHTIVFAAGAAVVIAPLIMRVTGATFVRGVAIAFASLVLHDVCDLFQGTDRMLLWPMWDRDLPVPAVIPMGLGYEAAIFGGLLAVVWLVCRARGGGHQEPHASESDIVEYRRNLWAGRGLTGVVVVAAACTHLLQMHRRQQIDDARRLIRRGDCQGALALLERAGRWPYSSPGRAEYWKGVAYAKLGERTKAEASYERSCAEEPSDFWPFADLAALRACGSEPQTARRARVEPMLAILRRRFGDHPDLPAMVARIERCLNDDRGPQNRG